VSGLPWLEISSGTCENCNRRKTDAHTHGNILQYLNFANERRENSCRLKISSYIGLRWPLLRHNPFKLARIKIDYFHSIWHKNSATPTTYGGVWPVADETRRRKIANTRSASSSPRLQQLSKTSLTGGEVPQLPGRFAGIRLTNMIKGYESVHLLEPEEPTQFHPGPAFGAGFIAGTVLLIVPHGSPWSSLTFFSTVIMGRTVPGPTEMPLLLVWTLHLAVSLVYGLIISRIVATLRWRRAFFTGALAGLVLYVVNFGVVSTVWPWLRGAEFSVVVTHIVFGLITAGAYRGLLKRKHDAPVEGIA